MVVRGRMCSNLIDANGLSRLANDMVRQCNDTSIIAIYGLNQRHNMVNLE